MSSEIKSRIIEAGRVAVEELIKVAQEPIVMTNSDDDIAPDKLKNAAMAKKLAIFDAFEILSRIEAEQEAIDNEAKGVSRTQSKQGFAEQRSKK